MAKQKASAIVARLDNQRAPSKYGSVAYDGVPDGMTVVVWDEQEHNWRPATYADRGVQKALGYYKGGDCWTVVCLDVNRQRLL